jgi:hypothetical protein
MASWFEIYDYYAQKGFTSIERSSSFLWRECFGRKIVIFKDYCIFRVDSGDCVNRKVVNFLGNQSAKYLLKPTNLKTKCSTRLNGIDMKIRKFSTQVGSPKSQVKFNPWWFVGFTDGEASFIISVSPSRLAEQKKLKTGFEVRAHYSIGVHQNDLPLLLEMKKFFGLIGRTYYY